MVTLSNIKKEPFLYSKINNILTPEENKFLYEVGTYYIDMRKSDYEDGSFFILDDMLYQHKQNGIEWSKQNGLVQSNVGLKGFKNTETSDKYYKTLYNVKSRLYTLLDEYTDVFPILYNEFEYFEDVDVNSFEKLTPRRFELSVSISSFFEESKLYPHNDWILDLQKENGVDDLKKLQSGRYKGVIYIGDDNLDYTGYGTRVYRTRFVQSEIEEIPYIPGNGVIFRSEPNSFHGTEYPKNSENPRITITFEYY